MADALRPLFYCQREAAETVIYLLELALPGRLSATGFRTFQVGAEDLDRLKAVLPQSKKAGGGIAGVIAGRALYHGRLDLRSAITALKAA